MGFSQTEPRRPHHCTPQSTRSTSSRAGKSGVPRVGGWWVYQGVVEGVHRVVYTRVYTSFMPVLGLFLSLA